MKEVQVKIPEYISIGKHQELQFLDQLQPLDRMLKVIQTLSDFTEEQIKEWPLQTIAEVSHLLSNVTVEDNEFHAIVQFKDEMYGFANLSRSKFGEYLDLENLLKDPINNLHQIAALLYRPITKHRFDSFSFQYKHGVDTVTNNVKDPFKWYTIEKYDSELREERSEMMKDFPTQIILGAMGFTSATAMLGLNSTLSSMKIITEKEKMEAQKKILKGLSESITGGGGLYTDSLKPIFSVLQEIPA